MALRNRRTLRVLLAGACIAGAAGATGGAAAQWGGNDWRHDRHVTHTADAIFILNGERICIDGRSVVYGIAEALRCKGYRVSVHDGCITVHYRGNAPRVSLTGCDYDISVTRSRGCLFIRPYQISHHSYGQHDRHWSHNRHWDRRSSHRWRSYPSSGFTIRIGGRCR